MENVRKNLNNMNKIEDLDRTKKLTTKGLRIFHQNICGLTNKIN